LGPLLNVGRRCRQADTEENGERNVQPSHAAIIADSVPHPSGIVHDAAAAKHR
jgi:hypothetical protein